MRFLAKLILGFGILLVAGVALTAGDQMSNGALRASVAALASGEKPLSFGSGQSAKTTEKPLVAYLPAPQLGWKPQAWTPEIRSIMDMPRIPPMPDTVEHEEVEEDLPFGVVNMTSVSSMPNAVVYRRGSEIVIISIHKTRGGIEGVVIDRIAVSTGERNPFARFGPATYVEHVDVLVGSNGLSRELFARIGGRIDIQVEARARDSSIKSLLSKIDHAGIVADYGLEVETGKPVTGTLPQVTTSTYDDPLANAFDDDIMMDAVVEQNWLLRLSRWLGGSSKPEPKKAGVVVRRGGREGCETNRGGCPMASMTFP